MSCLFGINPESKGMVLCEYTESDMVVLPRPLPLFCVVCDEDRICVSQLGCVSKVIASVFVFEQFLTIVAMSPIFWL